jgi:ABC-type multidrug transport system permease subunit
MNDVLVLSRKGERMMFSSICLILIYLSFPADVKKWWIWGYWISPLSYAQNAISTNEFLGHSWSKVSEPYIS